MLTIILLSSIGGASPKSALERKRGPHAPDGVCNPGGHRPGMKEMTSRQREILEFVRIFSERHGVPLAVREIGERFGFTARAAFDHLKALERKGMLERRATTKRASRTLVLPRRRSGHRQGREEIPVLGRIAAGTRIMASENREDRIPVRPEWLGAQAEDVFAI